MASVPVQIPQLSSTEHVLPQAEAHLRRGAEQLAKAAMETATRQIETSTNEAKAIKQVTEAQLQAFQAMGEKVEKELVPGMRASQERAQGLRPLLDQLDSFDMTLTSLEAQAKELEEQSKKLEADAAAALKTIS